MHRMCLLTFLAATPFAMAVAQGNGSVPVDVQKALHSAASQEAPFAFRDLHAAVAGGVVTLSGSVPVYRDKFAAEVAVSQVRGVRALQDDLQVAGPPVSDAVLRARLENRVHAKAISIEVHEGVVDLQGRHIAPPVAAAAFLAAASLPGVRGITDRMLVDRWGPEVGTGPYTISALPAQ